MRFREGRHEQRMKGRLLQQPERSLCRLCLPGKCIINARDMEPHRALLTGLERLLEGHRPSAVAFLYHDLLCYMGARRRKQEKKVQKVRLPARQ